MNLRALRVSFLLAAVGAALACSPDSGDESEGGGDGGGSNGAGGSGVGGMGAGGATARPPFEPGTDPNRNNVTAGNVCERLAHIQCAGEQHCCAAPGRTFDACKATQLEGCREDAFLDAITLEAQTGFDAAAAAAAFTEFERKSERCDVDVGIWATTAAGLRGIVKGTRGYGESCQPAGLPGPNAATAAYLASCRDPATTACLPTLTSWQCGNRAQAGGPCFTDVNCQDELFCPNPKLDPVGARCEARKADGAACATGNECASFACVNKLCAAATDQTAYCLPK